MSWHGADDPIPGDHFSCDAIKTLIVGMTFLATFTFAFVGLGLFLTFIRSLMPGWREAEDTL